MHMATMTRRLQILIDEGRLRRLERLAAQRDSSIATLVRDALDRTYDLSGADPTAAAERFLAREPIDVPDWPDAKAEIEAGYERR